jgi:hypothetical protein
MTGVRFAAGEDIFSLLHSVQTSSEAHTFLYPVDTGGFSPGLNQPRHDADHLPSSSAEVKNGEAITPFTPIYSWSELYTHSLMELSPS